MKWNIVAVVLAVVLFGGGYYYYMNKHSDQSSTPPPTSETSQTQSDTSTQPSTATNYDECIAEGNKPLASDPTKCLTKDGHLFIQGVDESGDQ